MQVTRFLEEWCRSLMLRISRSVELSLLPPEPPSSSASI